MAVIIADANNAKYGTGVATVVINNPGAGYSATDVLTLVGGDANATVTVSSVDGLGAITGITLTTRGSGYSVGTEATSGGGGLGATINITVHAGLSTVNGFYAMGAGNMGMMNGTTLATSTKRNIPVTFASAGNCQGLIITIVYNSSIVSDKSVVVELKQGAVVRATATLTMAQITNSAVDPASNGGYVTAFKFATPYAVTTAGSTWSFDVSETGTVGDVRIATSNGTAPFYITWCDVQTSFADNDTPVAVDKIIIDRTATFRAIGLGTGDTLRSICAIACNNMTDTTPEKVSLFEWENPALASYTITLNGLFVLSAHGGFRAGTATNPIAIAQKGTITTVRTPLFGSAGNAGFSCPKHTIAPATPSRKSNLFLYGETPTVARTKLSYNLERDLTATMTIASPCVVTVSGHGMTVPTPVKFTTTGALPTGVTAGATYWAGNFLTNTFNLYDTYDNALAGGVTGRVNTSGSQSGTHTRKGVLITNDTTGWVSGNEIFVGKYDSMGSSLNEVLTVNSSSGRTVDTSAVGTVRRMAGGAVCKLNDYGLRIINDTPATISNWNIYNPTNFIIKGCEIKTVGFVLLSSNVGTSLDDSANTLRYYFGYNSVLANNSAQMTSVISLYPNEKGFTFEHNTFIAGFSLRASYSKVQGISGDILIDNNWCPYGRGSSWDFSNTILRDFVFTNNVFENFSNGGQIFFSTIDAIIQNNSCWGMAISGQPQLSAMFSFWNNINTGTGSILNNSFDRCQRAILVYLSNIDIIVKDSLFGQEFANTADVYPSATAVGNFEINSSTGVTTVDTETLGEAVSTFRLAITDDNNVANTSTVYAPFGFLVRTGDGLTDTTVKTAGVGKYAIRFESNDSSQSLEWAMSIPTGDIQNKTMTVGLWVKLNSANYYSGTHRMPRLTINYDNGTEAYASALPTTDWQFVSVFFTPTTTFGKITASLCARTDQTGSNAYVYFDDISVLYPAGYSLNLGGLDLWSGGFPVTPPIATSISAQDVWAADPTTFGDNTVGGKVNNIKKDTGLIPALL